MNNKDITNNIIEFKINLLKSYLKSINITENIYSKFLKFLYKKHFEELFTHYLMKYNNDNFIKEKIKNIKKTDYNSFAIIINEINEEYNKEISSNPIIELLLLQNIGKISIKKSSIFYDKLKEFNNNNNLIFELNNFFAKFALDIIMYNLFYNKKFVVKDVNLISKNILKVINKTKYKNLGIDFTFKIIFEPYMEEYANFMSKSLSK